MLVKDQVKDSVVSANVHEILENRFLTENTFILRLNRGVMKFRAGQRIIAGLPGDLDQREYSVYSAENDDYLEVLVREVKSGNVSSKLKKCVPGQFLQINGPFGSFGIETFDLYSRKHVFIATGTGISPFHSMVRSYKDLDYTLIHGVRYSGEAYERNEYDNSRYIICTSKEYSGGRKGRVTGFLPKYSITPDMLFYLCGNGNMIYEVYHILRDKGIAEENIISEIYF